MKPLITQEKFTEALTEGISIPVESNSDMFSFGERMIRWINSTDNIYWAAWCPDNPHRVIMDLRNCELMQLHIHPGILLFRRMEDDIEHDMAKEFGNGALGIMIFCMLENGEIEEFDLDAVIQEDKTPPKADQPEDEDDSGAFDWV